jgi:Transposase DDE domain
VFVRASTRRNSAGVPVRYLQLVHNVWDPASRTSKAKVLHSFGREDELDRAAIERLIVSLRRMLDPTAALAGSPVAPAVDEAPGTGLSFLSSRALGATWVLDEVWHSLGLDGLLRRLLADARRGERVERVLFGLVAARAICPASKLATAAWLSRRTHIGGLTDDPPATDGDGDEQRPAVGDDECYRAMDWLIQAAPRVEREVLWSLATLLDLEVDLLFFDTTSTYFQTEDADPPVARDERGHPRPDGRANSTTVDERPADQAADGTGEEAAAEEAAEECAGQSAADADGGQPGWAGFRTWGKSKDFRGDLPQIVIGMAVTRAGIPVRVWSWPGNTTDTALIRQAKADLREWTPARIVWVGDRGFTSAANRRDLRAGGHGYILGERLRSGSADAAAALARPGRYRTVADNLAVKEVKMREDERFVVCFTPEAADRDAALRQVMLDKLTELIAGSDKLTERKRAELAGQLSTMPALRRYLRTTPAGLLRVDKAAITAEARLDGTFLLRCSDPTMSAEDIARGYKQLFQIERGWRDLKTHLELRPVYHRLEHRIRAHVLLCWLALLLVRIIETKTGRTWAAVREDLQDLHVGVFAGPAGTFTQTSEPTAATRAVLAALDLPAPKKVLRLDPAT